MSQDHLLDALLQSAEDHHLSRSERKALRAVLGEAELSDEQRLALQQALVGRVADRFADPRDRALVHWLGDALALLAPRADRRFAASRAWFGPEEPMVEQVRAVLDHGRRCIDVAVFTITDDRLADALLSAHGRGVRVRVLTDDDKAHDKGSDVFRLERAGVPVAYDHSPFHFHHKFAVVDERLLLTGSYNWTRGADRDNRENFLVSEEPPLVARYQHAFERLWGELRD